MCLQADALNVREWGVMFTTCSCGPDSRSTLSPTLPGLSPYLSADSARSRPHPLPQNPPTGDPARPTGICSPAERRHYWKMFLIALNSMRIVTCETVKRATITQNSIAESPCPLIKMIAARVRAAKQAIVRAIITTVSFEMSRRTGFMVFSLFSWRGVNFETHNTSRAGIAGSAEAEPVRHSPPGTTMPVLCAQTAMILRHNRQNVAESQQKR